MEPEVCDFFISYSGAFGQWFAKKMKEMLCTIYGIGSEQIFVASDNLHGSEWVKRIQEHANSCKIGVSCLTEETYNNEWILFELGAMNSAALVIPLAIDFPLNRLHGHDIYMKNQCKSSIDRTNSLGKFLDEESIDYLLQSFFSELESPENQSVFNSIHKRKCNCNFLEYKKKHKKYYEQQVKDIKDTYNRLSKKYACFISRPMRGYQYSDRLSDFLSDVFSGSNKNIYFSKNMVQMDESNAEIIGIGDERILNIRNSSSFVMIYPQIKGEQPPSSCMIELGAALAMGKDVKVFYEKGAVLPFFIEKKENVIQEYTDFQQLRELLRNHFQLEK